MSFLQANEDLIQTSNCLGADNLMKLLGNYCRNKDIKTTIRVGVVGLPNTGKSSIINSLKRAKACNVGSTPGVTKQMQEVQLDKHIRLLDSPGVVMATGNSDTSVILRNCVRLEGLQDPMTPIEAILRRCNKQQMMLHYCITEYNDASEFLSLLAKRLGQLKKGGVPDKNKAAKTVLQHWNMGKIKYYTHPPEQTTTHIASEFVTEMGKEFDIDSLLADQQKTIQSLDQRSTKHMLVESMGPANVVMQANEIDKLIMEADNKMAASEDESEEDSEEDVELEEEEVEVEEEMEESEEDDEMQQVTVSLPASKPRSQKDSGLASTPASVPQTSASKKAKLDRLNVGLPQLNKNRKMDFKKMKKQRKRREKVAGELSDALTAAFDLGGEGNKGDDSYQFDDHF